MIATMRRRTFITLLGGAAAAWPFRASAQTPKRPLIGFLAPASKATSGRFHDGFPQGMRELGYLEGRDYGLEERYADGDVTRLPLLAKDLVRLEPTLIVAGTTSAALAAKQATTSIPVVGVNLTDPIGMGLVANEARPGANVTGILFRVEGLTSKQIEIARELLPSAAKIGVLRNPVNVTDRSQWREAELAAAKVGVSLAPVEVRAGDEIGGAFQRFVQDRADIVAILADPMLTGMRRQIGAFALAAHLPTVNVFREHVEDGGMISYGVDLRRNYYRAAAYVDKILKGARPGDLPVEFPTKLDLVINLATARALGIAIPPTLLARADEVIE
jgi:putative tryptophan/tyrosine transport system substrate-binding protein